MSILLTELGDRAEIARAVRKSGMAGPGQPVHTRPIARPDHPGPAFITAVANWIRNHPPQE